MVELYANVSLLTGSIGTAVLEGFVSHAVRQPESMALSACVTSSDSLIRLRDALGERCKHVTLGFGREPTQDMAEQADLIVLGCRPQDLVTLANTLGPRPTYAVKTVVSRLAGVSCQRIRQQLAAGGVRKDMSFVRVIPTIGARTGNSVSLLSYPETVSQSNIELVRRAFGKIGTVLTVPEELMSKATAAGAVCHALAVLAVNKITDASVAEGIPRSTAMALATQSLSSAAGFMAAEEGGITAEQLEAALSTPKGITLNSVVNLEKEGAGAAIGEATRAAIRYAESI